MDGLLRILDTLLTLPDALIFFFSLQETDCLFIYFICLIEPLVLLSECGEEIDFMLGHIYEQI